MEEEKYSWPWALEEGNILLPEAEKSCQHQYRDVSAPPAPRKSIGFQTPQNLSAGYCPCWNISTDSVKWLQPGRYTGFAFLSSMKWSQQAVNMERTNGHRVGVQRRGTKETLICGRVRDGSNLNEVETDLMSHNERSVQVTKPWLLCARRYSLLRNEKWWLQCPSLCSC